VRVKDGMPLSRPGRP